LHAGRRDPAEILIQDARNRGGIAVVQRAGERLVGGAYRLLVLSGGWRRDGV